MEQTPTIGTISSGFGITKFTAMNDGYAAESNTESSNGWGNVKIENTPPNKPTDKYIQYFSNGEDDLDDETLKKIFSNDSATLNDPKVIEWLKKNEMKVFSVNDKPFKILDKNVKDSYVDDSYVDGLKGKPVGGESSFSASIPMLRTDAGEYIIPYGQTGTEDVTKEFAEVAYITPHSSPVILVGSKACEATCRKFDTEKEVLDFLHESNLIVYQVIKRVIPPTKYMVRYYAFNGNDLEISYWGMVFLKLQLF